jgi:transcription termination factor NusA
MPNGESNSGEEFVALFIRGAGATRDEAIALRDAGFSALEEIAYVPIDELHSAMRNNVARADELRANARRSILKD